MQHKQGYGRNNIYVKLTGLQQSDYGWLAVLGVVAVVEIVGAERQQMLSHATVRYNAAHPIVTTSVVLTTAAHLLGWIPAEVDPYHQAYGLVRFLRHIINAATPANNTAINGT